MGEELSTTIQGKMRVVEGEPRWLDLDIAEWIGLDHPHKFRARARRSEPTLAKLGIITNLVIIPEGAGAPGEEYWLNEKQCYYLIARSQQTPRAEQVTVAIVEAAYNYRHGKLAPRGPMSLDEREFFRKLTDTLGQLCIDSSSTKKEIGEIKQDVTTIKGDIVDIKQCLRGARHEFPPKIVMAILRSNFEIDRGMCTYCAKTEVVEKDMSGRLRLMGHGCLDHVHQRNRRDFENCICSCKACNQDRETNRTFRRETIILAEAFHLKAKSYNPDRNVQRNLFYSELVNA
jgi:hypothetical protein